MMYEKEIQPNIRRMITPSGRPVRIMDYATLRYYITEIIDVDREEACMDADGEITINWKDSRGQGFGVYYSEWMYANQGFYIGQYLDDGAWKLFHEDEVAEFNLDGDQTSEQTKDPSHVTIFLADGNTLRFDDVEFIDNDKDEIEGFKDPEGIMTFLYRSSGDAHIKTGLFNLNNPNIIGCSIYDQNTEKAQENGGK